MRYASALLLVLALCGCDRPKPVSEPLLPIVANEARALLTITSNGTCTRWNRTNYEDCWPLDHPAVIERQIGDGWSKFICPYGKICYYCPDYASISHADCQSFTGARAD
jgi:hypothetical protein